jgi:hypothetical protein
MKKPFRVATLFTGAAAAAAAFAPTAAAMPATQAATTHKLAPDASAKDCGSATKGWTYLYYEASEHHGPICLGGTGKVPLDSHIKIAGYCAGANKGLFHAKVYTSQGLKSYSQIFDPRSIQSFSHPVYMKSVYLSSHSGPPYFSCPTNL